jgi:hypothetical protein
MCRSCTSRKECWTFCSRSVGAEGAKRPGELLVGALRDRCIGGDG